MNPGNGLYLRKHRAPSGTRTHTVRILSPLPLPIGLWGRCSSEGTSVAISVVQPLCDVATVVASIDAPTLRNGTIFAS